MAARTSAPRTAEDYMKLPYTLRVIPDPTGGYVGTVEELPGCITQGETWGEVGEMLRDAMLAWITSVLEAGQAVPLPREVAAPARVLLRLPGSLHEDLKHAAAQEGVSLNQYLLYVVSSAVGRPGLTSTSARTSGDSAHRHSVRAGPKRAAAGWSQSAG